MPRCTSSGTAWPRFASAELESGCSQGPEVSLGAARSNGLWPRGWSQRGCPARASAGTRAVTPADIVSRSTDLRSERETQASDGGRASRRRKRRCGPMTGMPGFPLATDGCPVSDHGQGADGEKGNRASATVRDVGRALAGGNGNTGLTVPLNEMILAERFEPKVAALKAARQYIDRTHERRIRRKGHPRAPSPPGAARAPEGVGLREPSDGNPGWPGRLSRYHTKSGVPGKMIDNLKPEMIWDDSLNSWLHPGSDWPQGGTT